MYLVLDGRVPLVPVVVVFEIMLYLYVHVYVL
jgi:hypothetical protein